MIVDNAVTYNINLITNAINNKVAPIASAGGTILDVGGGDQPLNLATHVIDIQPFKEDGIYRFGKMGLDKFNSRFTKETWIQHDICSYPWPFKDKTFDFVWCTQTLEDIRDPIGVVKEMMRIGKAGYINCPGKLSELLSPISSYLGADNYNGYWHHRWLVSKENGVLVFEQKHAFAFFLKWTDDELIKIIKEHPEIGSTDLYWENEVYSTEIISLCPTTARNTLEKYIKGIKQKYGATTIERKYGFFNGDIQ